MNKKATRYTPFTGKYQMKLDDFCRKYGLSLRVVLHRMNMLQWDDFDSLLIPQELGDTPADKIKRALKLVKMGWKNEEIEKRLNLPLDIVVKIQNLNEHQKKMFMDMDEFYYFIPERLDLDNIFHEVPEEKRSAMEVRCCVGEKHEHSSLEKKVRIKTKKNPISDIHINKPDIPKETVKEDFTIPVVNYLEGVLSKSSVK